MRICKRNLWHKTFHKWTSKSFWTTKTQKPKTNNNKRTTNPQTNNKWPRNKSPNKKMANKRWTYKAKSNHWPLRAKRKSKRTKDQNMKVSPTLMRNSSKAWRSSMAWVMNWKSCSMSETQLEPKERSFWYQRESENSLKQTSPTRSSSSTWAAKSSRREKSHFQVTSVYTDCAKREFTTFYHGLKTARSRCLLTFSRKFFRFTRWLTTISNRSKWDKKSEQWPKVLSRCTLMSKLTGKELSMQLSVKTSRTHFTWWFQKKMLPVSTSGICDFVFNLVLTIKCTTKIISQVMNEFIGEITIWKSTDWFAFQL